jgi:hypothetical protein
MVVRMPQWPERRAGLHVVMVPVIDGALCVLVHHVLPVDRWPSWNGHAIQ